MAVLCWILLGILGNGDPGIVRGRVILTEESRVTTSSPTGSMQVRVRVGRDRAVSRTVPVEEGCFEFSVADRARVQFAGAHLEDQAAYLIEDEYLADPTAEPLSLRAEVVRELILRVRDAATGKDLDKIQLVHCEWTNLDSAHYPGPIDPADLRHQDASSPVPLTPRHAGGFDAPETTYWVGRRGYEWTRVPVDFQRGGVFEAWLQRGAELFVELKEIPVRNRVTMHVRYSPSLTFQLVQTVQEAAERERVARSAVQYPIPGDDYLRVGGLGPGLWLLTFELGGKARQEPYFLATEAVELHRGGPTLVVPSWRDPPVVQELVRLQGSIELHPEWGDLPFTLQVMPKDVEVVYEQEQLEVPSVDMVREGATYHWDAGDVGPGSYALRVPELAHGILTEVASGFTPPCLRVGRPVDLVVTVVASHTGQPIQADEIRMCHLESEDAEVVVWMPLSLDESTGQHQRVVPEGWLRLHTWRPGFQLKEHMVHVTAETPEVEWAMDLNTMVYFQLRCAGEVYSRPDGFLPKVIPVGGKGQLNRGWSQDLETRGWMTRIEGDPPEDCWIVFPEIPGFQPIPRRRIQVRPHEVTRVMVDLQRLKD